MGKHAAALYAIQQCKRKMKIPCLWEAGSRRAGEQSHNVSAPSSLHSRLDFAGCLRRVFYPAHRRSQCQGGRSQIAGLRHALCNRQSVRHAPIHSANGRLWLHLFSCLLVGSPVSASGERDCKAATRHCNCGAKLYRSEGHLRLRRTPCTGVRCGCWLQI